MVVASTMASSDVMASSLLAKVDAHARRCRERHDDVVMLLSKFRVAKDDVVLADGQRHVADWRLARFLAVDPHFGPRLRVQRDAALRPLDFDWRDLARRDLDDGRRAVAERLVHELDLVAAGGHDDALAGLGR